MDKAKEQRQQRIAAFITQQLSAAPSANKRLLQQHFYAMIGATYQQLMQLSNCQRVESRHGFCWRCHLRRSLIGLQQSRSVLRSLAHKIFNKKNI